MLANGTMNTFKRVLWNVLLSSVTANFLWFAVTFWAYLETRSVLATGVIGGSFMLLSSVFGLVFGSAVDRNRKKAIMSFANAASLVAFAAAGVLFATVPDDSLLSITGFGFWALVMLVLAGAVVGNLRMIALSTLVTLLVPEPEHSRANGLIGTVNGVAFAITSVFSGLVVGTLGLGAAIIGTVGLTLIATIDLSRVSIPEEQPDLASTERKSPIDLRGAMIAVRAVPGLLGMIFFTTFNNFLGGVFMTLVDPYGLELVSVEVWGLIWGFLSAAFILGGIIVARRGLGPRPLRVLFLCNIAIWLICILFPLRSSIVPLVIGFFVFNLLIPAIEASEQTIIQRVVPYEVQGRVFGFAQAVETAASPITAYLVAPLAEFWVIPWMTTGRGSETIGAWFGTGPDRGMALVFVIAGVGGLLITILAMRSRAYRTLSESYRRAIPD